MKRYYVFKDGMQQGSAVRKEEAIDMIRYQQKRETHPILRAEFSIIYGEEQFVPYPKLDVTPRRKQDMER